MKKLWKRILAAAAAGLVAAGGAFAEGKPAADLLDAGYRLLLETPQAELQTHAVFTLDGKVFKMADVTVRVKDGGKMQVVTMTTPRNGENRVSGYTVVRNAEGGVSAVESHRTDLIRYSDMPDEDNTGLIRKRADREHVWRFAGDVADLLLGGAMKEEKTAEGTVWTLKLNGDDLPDAVDSGAWMVYRWGLKRYRGYETSLATPGELPREISYYYEDEDAFYAQCYRDVIGGEMPEGFMERVYAGDEEAAKAYEPIAERVNQIWLDASAQKGPVILIRNDGTAESYPDLEQMLQAIGKVWVDYEDYMATFADWYEKKTGKQIQENFVDLLWSGAYPGLSDAYYAMSAEMEQFYEDEVRKIEGLTIAQVAPDGTITKLTENTADYGTGATTAETVFRTMAAMDIREAEMTVQADGEGRITHAEGSIAFDLVTPAGEHRPMTVTVTADAAYDGITIPEIETTDAYHDMVNRRWFGEDDPVPEEEDLPVLPDTVEFNGTVYHAQMEE